MLKDYIKNDHILLSTNVCRHASGNLLYNKAYIYYTENPLKKIIVTSKLS